MYENPAAKHVLHSSFLFLLYVRETEKVWPENQIYLKSTIKYVPISIVNTMIMTRRDIISRIILPTLSSSSSFCTSNPFDDACAIFVHNCLCQGWAFVVEVHTCFCLDSSGILLTFRARIHGHACPESKDIYQKFSSYSTYSGHARTNSSCPPSANKIQNLFLFLEFSAK
jgi:hypothetical protein